MESEFNVVELPRDIIVNILSLSSAKTLLRFRCVSKTWYNLIHDPEFISMHRIVHKNDKCVLIHEHVEACLKSDFFRWKKPDGNNEPQSELLIDTSLLEECNSGYTRFYGSSDGLVCLSSQAGNGLYIWNPSIKKLKSVSPQSYLSSHFCGYHQWRVYGFGKNAAGDDYKVVSITYKRSRIRYDNPAGEVDVYSLRTNSWRKCDAIVDVLIPDYSKTPSVWVSGRLHWLGSDKRSLVSFDLHSEVVREPTMPKLGYCEHVMCIGSFKDALAVISTEAMNIYVWVMEEHDDAAEQSWHRLYTFCQDTPPCIAVIYVGSGSFIAKMSDGQFSIFDYEMRRFIKLEDHGGDWFPIFSLIDYTESLVLLDEI